MEKYSGYEIDHTPVSGRSRSRHYRMKKDSYVRLAYAMERRAKSERGRGDDRPDAVASDVRAHPAHPPRAAVHREQR